MTTENLWGKLPIPENTSDIVKMDLAEGKVPELPFFVVGSDDAKNVMLKQLENIDGQRMLTNMLIGAYGNGKTNILKYLQLYFKNNPKVHVVFSTANVDQPDIVLFLLKQVQEHYSEKLVEIIQNNRNEIEIAGLAGNFENKFKAIEEYSRKLVSPDVSEEILRKLIYLGSGRLYTRNEFTKLDIPYLSNFERREILILFLNLLSWNKSYIIFQIDEIEKMREKSVLRFNIFLTSYREIFDLFSHIKGHYLLCCLTAADSAPAAFRVYNEAFYSRIERHIILLSPITSKPHISELVGHLSELFNKTKSKSELDKIVSILFKEHHNQNRALLRHASALLDEDVFNLVPLDKLLEQRNLSSLYQETFEELELEGLFKNLTQKFFDPLKHYLMGNNMLELGSELDVRDNQAFIDKVNGNICHFILNENNSLSSIQAKIDKLVNEHNLDVVIFSPELMELKNGTIKSDRKIEIVDYDPKYLFVLLNMFRDNFERSPEITAVIRLYTNNTL